MSVLAAHLRKEWREQRLLVAAVAVAVPALVLVTFIALGAAREQGPSWTPVFLGGAALVTALALASDAFAGEAGRGTLRFLRRQPGALGAAAVAKTLVYVAAVASSVLWAAASTWGAAYVTGGSHLSDEVARTLVDEPVVWTVPFGILVAGAWALPCSTWIPRGSVAVAGAALLLGGLALPGALLWGERDRFLATRIAPAPGLWVAALALPLALFGWSMARGHRFVARSARVASVGLVVVVVASAAGYAWAGRSFHAWLRPDPRSLEARLAWAFVSRGERHAYVNVGRRDDPAVARAVRVDLRTGEVHEFAPPGHVVSLAASLGTTSEVTPPEGHEVLSMRPGDLVQGSAEGRFRYFDAQTEEDLGWAESRATFPTEEPARTRLEAASRRATSVRTPEGLRAWRTAAGFDREEADGRVTSVRFPAGVTYGSTMHWGWIVRTPPGSFLAVAATDPGPVATPVPWGQPTSAYPVGSLSPTEMLVRSPQGEPAGWYVWDRPSGAFTPVPGTTASDPTFVAIDSRRLLGATAEGAWVQVDVRDGTRTVVRDAVESSPWWAWPEARTPRGRLVVRGSPSQYALYDPDERRVVGQVIPWHRGVRLLHASDERALFLVEERAIDAYRWDDGRVERLFPR